MVKHVPFGTTFLLHGTTFIETFISWQNLFTSWLNLCPNLYLLAKPFITNLPPLCMSAFTTP
jgi:hypothetical protein